MRFERSEEEERRSPILTRLQANVESPLQLRFQTALALLQMLQRSRTHRDTLIEPALAGISGAAPAAIGRL